MVVAAIGQVAAGPARIHTAAVAAVVAAVAHTHRLVGTLWQKWIRICQKVNAATAPCICGAS